MATYIATCGHVAVRLYAKTVSVRVVRHSLAYLSMRKWLVGDIVLKVNILSKVNHLLARE